MACTRFPVIDPAATGRNIARAAAGAGLHRPGISSGFFGFEEPQAIYKWQRGQSLPSIDNLYALSHLFQISMNEILVPVSPVYAVEQQASACCSTLFIPYTAGHRGYGKLRSRMGPYPPEPPALPVPERKGSACGFPGDFI